MCHKQDTAPVTSTIPIGHKSESDAQLQQQEALESLTQQVEQLSSDVDQLTADMKQTSVTYTQVTQHQTRCATVISQSVINVEQCQKTTNNPTCIVLWCRCWMS